MHRIYKNLGSKRDFNEEFKAIKEARDFVEQDRNMFFSYRIHRRFDGEHIVSLMFQNVCARKAYNVPDGWVWEKWENGDLDYLGPLKNHFEELCQTFTDILFDYIDEFDEEDMRTQLKIGYAFPRHWEEMWHHLFKIVCG